MLTPCLAPALRGGLHIQTPTDWNVLQIHWLVAQLGLPFLPSCALPRQQPARALARQFPLFPSMAALAAALPKPVHTYHVKDESAGHAKQLSVAREAIPAYPHRAKSGWRPTSASAYGDGGAFPEIHVAQFPLGMGRPGRKSSKVLTMRTDGSGQARHDMVVQQHAKGGKRIQSRFTDLVEHRAEAGDSLARPSAEEEAETTNRTKAALERLVGSAVSAARPTKLWNEQSEERHRQSQYFRYTPSASAPGYNAAVPQRVIKVMEAPVDPMEPPNVKHKKVPGGPPSPPVPIMHSQAKKISVAEQQAWKIPPCVSNWKNHKGYTVPLDKRLAADGRSLRETTINDKFAGIAEALYLAEQKCSEQVRKRAEIASQLELKRQKDKQEQLRAMAAQTRMARAGVVVPPAGVEGGHLAQAAPTYAGESDSDEDRAPGAAGQRRERTGGHKRARSPLGAAAPPSGGAQDPMAVQREQARLERRRERERDLRMEAAGKKAKTTRDADRDVSERVALGMPVAQTLKGEAMFDSRLFNQSGGMDSGFGADDEYNAYDKAWRSSTARSIYRPTRAEGAGVGTAEEQIGALKSARSFKPDVDFEGVDRSAAPRTGPVAFTRAEGGSGPGGGQDVFGLDSLMGASAEQRGGGRASLAALGKQGSMAAAAGGSGGGSGTVPSRAPAFHKAGS